MRIKKRAYQQRQPDGSVVERTTAKYYGFFQGRYVPLCTDRQASETMLRELKSRLEKNGAGIIDPATLASPIGKHIDEYEAYLERQGREEHYIRVVVYRVKVLADACDWGTIRGITIGSVEGWIDKVRRTLAPKTINHTIAAAKGFCNWCVDRGRLYQNPLARLHAVPIDEVKRPRRAMAPSEIVRLLDQAGPRRLLYLVAIYTGLRRAELKKLQWGDVRIDGVPSPFIQLRETATKARRADVLPLREDLGAELRKARPADASASARVFDRVPTMETFKNDLRRADIDFMDGDNRRIDLHALRHTYCTMLATAGVNPREAMGLMRHTDIRLTTKVYTDEHLLPLRAAVEKLPTFAPPAHAQERLRATGSLGGASETKGANSGDIQSHRCNDGATGPRVSGADNFLRSQRGKTGGKVTPADTSEPSAILRVSRDPDKALRYMAQHADDAEKMREVGLEPTRLPTGS